MTLEQYRENTYRLLNNNSEQGKLEKKRIINIVIEEMKKVIDIYIELNLPINSSPHRLLIVTLTTLEILDMNKLKEETQTSNQ